MIIGASKCDQWAEAKVFASQPDGKAGSSTFSVTSENEAKAFRKSASSEWEEKPKLKAFVVHFKWLDLGQPTGGCPNHIVLVGRNPAPHGFFPPTSSDSQFITWRKIPLITYRSIHHAYDVENQRIVHTKLLHVSRPFLRNQTQHILHVHNFSC